MKFIKLTKIDGNDIALNAEHITCVEVCPEQLTWIELLNGNKFMVHELAEDILSKLKADLA